MVRLRVPERLVGILTWMATTTGAGGPGFATTAWSVIRRAQDPDSPGRRRAMDRLISVYWRPIYWSLRIDWKEDAESAKDLTQEYLATFLEEDLVRGLSAERGRFRAFVKATLKNFMLEVRRSKRALKRGGGRVITLSPEEISRQEAEGGRTYDSPEALFDRELLRSVLADAMSALEKEMGGQGRRDRFDAFRRYYAEGPTYETLAAELRIPVTDLTNRLYEARRRYRELVIERLRDGVMTEDELAAEVRELLG